MTKVEVVAIKYFFKSQIKREDSCDGRDWYRRFIINDCWESNFDKFLKELEEKT